MSVPCVGFSARRVGFHACPRAVGRLVRLIAPISPPSSSPRLPERSYLASPLVHACCTRLYRRQGWRSLGATDQPWHQTPFSARKPPRSQRPCP